MSGNLPRNFTDKMEKLLGNEFDNFMASYDAPRVYGLRINRLKLSVEQWRELSPMGDDVRPIPWTEDGLYYKEGERPGKHPHYHAGIYYIQEPSAMAPVELLDVRQGHRVLDLCAAPGGKSTQIAGKLQGSGVLVTNDNAKERTKALVKNVELAGIRNAIVLNEEPAKLAPVFKEWFDRILVDAPCSGEGMFRKDESMIAEWEKHSIERCSVMQKDILRHAASMLAPGGKIVYSTCTFSPEENEIQIAAFLAEHLEFHVEAVPHLYGWTAGRSDLADDIGQLTSEQLKSLDGTVRLWPHRIEGEGHYAAVLKRDGERNLELEEAGFDNKETNPSVRKEDRSNKSMNIKSRPDNSSATNSNGGSLKRQRRGDERREGKRQTADAWKNIGMDKQSGKRNKTQGKEDNSKTIAEEVNPVQLWRQYAEEYAVGALAWQGKLVAYGSRVYIQPAQLPSLDGLRVVRAGWYLGEAVRDRFEPSHPLAMGLKRIEAVRSVSWSSDDPQTLRFLKGETLFIEESELSIQADAPAKGFVLICTDGFPIGWGKYAGGMIKNALPAGWRMM